MNSPGPEVTPADVPGSPADLDGPSISAQDAADAGAFLASFADLPSIIQAKERLLERGYGEDDPVMTIIEALGLYDKRQEILTSRVLNAFANVIHRIESLQGEVGAIRPQIDELQSALEDSMDHSQVVSTQFGNVIRSNADFLPHLEKAGKEVSNAATLIENRSTKAVVLSYLAPAIALIAGIIIGIVVAGRSKVDTPTRYSATIPPAYSGMA